MYKKTNMFGREDILSLRITAGLTGRENDELCRLIEGQSKFDDIRLYLIIENYPLADSAESLLEDLKFVRLCAAKIDRMAVVGDRAWQETWTALFGLFSRIETAFFDRAEADDAAKWIAG